MKNKEILKSDIEELIKCNNIFFFYLGSAYFELKEDLLPEVLQDLKKFGKKYLELDNGDIEKDIYSLPEVLEFFKKEKFPERLQEFLDSGELEKL